MAETHVYYTVRVVVAVDEDTSEVLRVVVEDEDVTLDEPDPGRLSRRHAVAIAESEPWPAWEFGW